MPTVFELFGIKFFFFPNDHEPIHVHILYGGKLAKIQVEPEIKLIYNHGIKPKVVKKALASVETFKEDIVTEWHRYFPED